MRNWQSILSVMPPCPGIECPKSLMLNARLNPDAKKPPKGAKMDANPAMTMAWIWNGAYDSDGRTKPNWRVNKTVRRSVCGSEGRGE